jgi:hypothetical protein
MRKRDGGECLREARKTELRDKLDRRFEISTPSENVHEYQRYPEIARHFTWCAIGIYLVSSQAPIIVLKIRSADSGSLKNLDGPREYHELSPKQP